MSNGPPWLYYGLLVAAMACSVVQLFRMVGSAKSTTVLNVLAIVFIVLALTMRRRRS